MAVKKTITTLTDTEVEIFRRGKTDPSILSRYLFKSEANPLGWTFDYNFDKDGQWQNKAHAAEQKRIVVIGGFGSGKTRGIGMSVAVWCLLTRDFKFLNAAPLAWQSELMYRFILEMAEGTRFKDFIYNSPSRPYPRIELRYMLQGMLAQSTMEFMSVEKNASKVLSWEGDWINIEEGGLLEDLGDAIRNLGSRLRGSIKGRDRLGRMSIISNSWENPDLWYRYDMATSMPDDYLSMTVDSRHNHNITDDQMKMMLKDIPEDEHEQFISGKRPQGKGLYFSKESIYDCESQVFADLVEEAVKKEARGYKLDELYGAGVYRFELPFEKHKVYMLVGDPGTGEAPYRNAPCLMVWDVTDFPESRASLAAFWWGQGNGQISPFVRNLVYYMGRYRPIYTGIDSTGTQKNMSQILSQFLESDRTNKQKTEDWLDVDNLKNMENITINGLDFSGAKKTTYLVILKLFLEARLLVWPKNIVGIRAQLSNYDPLKDSGTKTKLSQDIVATMAMAAFAIRIHFSIDPQEILEGRDGEGTEINNNESYRLARQPYSERPGRS